MFGRFNGGDVAGQADECGPHVFARFTEQPPVVAIARPVVLISLRFDALQHPLVDGRKPCAHRLGIQPVEVNHQHIARAGGQVAAVSVLADVTLQTDHRAQAQPGRLGPCDDEAGAVQLDAG